jgi:LAO/AO transport system kinase
MELADLVVINKADGSNIASADRAVAEANNALHFLPHAPSAWPPRAIACSALTGRAIPDIWKCVLDHAALTQSNGFFEEKRRDQRRRWMHESLEAGLRQFFAAHPLICTRMETFEREVLDGQITPFRAARTLLEMYSNLGSGRAIVNDSPSPDARP